MPDIASLTCTGCGKQAYLSRRFARLAASILFPGRRMRAYQCAGHWHLTSQSALRTAAYRAYRAGNDINGKAVA